MLVLCCVHLCYKCAVVVPCFITIDHEKVTLVFKTWVKHQNNLRCRQYSLKYARCNHSSTTGLWNQCCYAMQQPLLQRQEVFCSKVEVDTIRTEAQFNQFFFPILQILGLTVDFKAMFFNTIDHHTIMTIVLYIQRWCLQLSPLVTVMNLADSSQSEVKLLKHQSTVFYLQFCISHLMSTVKVFLMEWMLPMKLKPTLLCQNGLIQPCIASTCNCFTFVVKLVLMDFRVSVNFLSQMNTFHTTWATDMELNSDISPSQAVMTM